MKKIILLNLLIAVHYFAFSQAGTLDPTFGNGGVITNHIPPTGNTFASFLRQCFPQTDGTTVLILDGGQKLCIARRLADGSRDLSFGNGGYSEFLTDISNPVAVKQADGKIIVAGNGFNNVAFALTRVNADGSTDATFGNGGITLTYSGSTNNNLNGIVIGADGKIYTGCSVQVNGSYRFAIYRYTSNGQADLSFGQNGQVITNFNDFNSYMSSIANTPDNKIMALGVANTATGNAYALAKYNLDGSPDMTFNSTGTAMISFDPLDIPTAMAISGDGRLYIGGYGPSEGYSHFRISRLNADGTIDLTYNNGLGTSSVGFGNTYDQLTNILLLPDGKLLAAGYTATASFDNYDVGLLRLNNDGTIDAGFGTNGIVTGDYNGQFDNNSILTTTTNGQIIIGGNTLQLQNSGTWDLTMFRYGADGIPDASFGTGGKLSDYIPRSTFSYNDVYNQADGKLMVLGISSDGNSKQFISRFNANGAMDNTFGQNGSVNLSTPYNYFFQPGGKVMGVGGNGSDFQLLRYNADGTVDNNFGNGGTVITDFGGDEGSFSAVTQNDGKVVVVGTQFTGTGSQLLVARYNNDGTIDNSFGNSGFTTIAGETENYPTSLLLQPDGKILVSAHGYLHPPDYSYFYLDVVMFRLNADGSPDNSFGQSGVLIKDHGSTEFAGNLGLTGDGKIVYTYFVQNNSDIQYFTERLNSDGSLDNSFGQNGRVDADGTTLVIQPDQKIVSAGFVPNESNFVLAAIRRANADGTWDNSFGTNGRLLQSFAPDDDFISQMRIIGNGLYVTGYTASRSQWGFVGKLRLDPTNGISCPSNVIANTDKNTCSAKVPGIDPTFPQGGSVKYKLTGATKGSGNVSASGKIFNKGITTVTYTLNGDATKTCSFTVTVQDKELPIIDNVSVSDETLWPADHKLKDVTVNYSASDNCGVANTQLSVSSNEPVQSNENGDQSPDWQITDAHHVKLRAERLDAGAGRIYTITITTTDVSGNVNNATVTVNVPKTKPVPCTLNLSATPNPSHNYFTVSVNSSCSDKINLRVLDNKGTVVTTVTNISAPQIVTVGNNLVPGIYYIEATQSGVSKSIKLVKQ